jgi:hypothetical protein
MALVTYSTIRNLYLSSRVNLLILAIDKVLLKLLYLYSSKKGEIIKFKKLKLTFNTGSVLNVV